ncbi:S1C family serine protease [Flavobacterium flavipallidum]|uniref:Trypsin-like peptidase domain-containing protein n=1 Tax=Flavobacterium flavipallidum TaxID=3139140 RepID=A0ABU9HMA2_9FLAO
MRKKLQSLLFLTVVSVLFASCASILNPVNQKVTVVNKFPKSQVFVDGVSQGEGMNVVSKVKRDGYVKQIKITSEGYKPVYKVFYQTKKSPFYIMSWIPFGILIYPPFLDGHVKSYDYKKELVVDEKPLAISRRNEDDKFVYLKNTSFDVKKEDLKIKRIKSKNYNKTNDKSKQIGGIDEDVKFDNSIFSEAVQTILNENNYSDNSNTVFKNKSNTLYISANISKIEFDNLYAYHMYREVGWLVTKAEIEWEIFDLYDQSKFKKKFTAKSGEFVIDKKESIKESVENAIEQSFYNFMNESEVKKIIKKDKEEKIHFDYLTLQTDQKVNNIEDALSSSVTIKREKSHGSGCVVSKDGYIVTNFHVVSGSEKITVLDSNGKEFEAKLIRKNEQLDLALIKVDATFKSSFSLNDNKYMVGDDIFVIGTPASTELGQTLTKGIVSGTRKNENNIYIQIDASVNPGNSGGALVKKSGEFIGIVNSKLAGLGYEGLGFSIPIQKIKEGLFLN